MVKLKNATESHTKRKVKNKSKVTETAANFVTYRTRKIFVVLRTRRSAIFAEYFSIPIRSITVVFVGTNTTDWLKVHQRINLKRQLRLENNSIETLHSR